MREKIAGRTDLMLIELCAWLRTDRAISVGTTALWRELRRLGLTLNGWPAPAATVISDGVVGLHQNIRSHGINPGQDGFRAPRAS